MQVNQLRSNETEGVSRVVLEVTGNKQLEAAAGLTVCPQG